jgi:TPR repeat protein
VPAPAAGPPVANAKASDLDPDGLIARGDEFLKIGDVASARLFYRLAANLGSARGAGALGWTFDPHYLEKAGITGVQPSPGDAMEWYRKAMALGDRDATNRFLVLVERLEKKAAQGDSEAKQLLEKLR